MIFHFVYLAFFNKGFFKIILYLFDFQKYYSYSSIICFIFYIDELYFLK